MAAGGIPTGPSPRRSFDSFLFKATLKVKCIKLGGSEMIQLNRLNGKEYVLNCELIKLVEATPDTIITLSTGEKLMVKNSVEEVVQRTLDYHKRIHQEPPLSEVNR